MRTYLPDQVYKDEQHASAVLNYLIGHCVISATPTKTPYVYGICLKENDTLIGHIGLSPSNGQVEVGYAIADEFQGRGFASEAVTVMSHWAIPRFSLPCLIAIVARDNVASCRVLERCGYVQSDESTRSLHGRAQLVRTYRWVAG